MSARGARVRRRMQGLAFLLAVLTLVGLSIGKYTGAFSEAVPVTLQADAVGNQLQERSDVKVRGLIVGEVSAVSSSGDVASVELAMQPDKIGLIPENVTARLLPKTLFGERFVSLVLPERPSERSLSAGDVIGQDRTETSREIESALDGLLPLLQAVEPQQLASTLSALSQSLEGRGDQLGDNLVQTQLLVSELNTALPELQDDITGLADLTETYSQAAPDLLAALADLTTTSRTVVAQRDQLSTLFDSVSTASGDTTAFLETNRANLIDLSADSRPTLESLARYAPQSPCFFGQLTGLIPKIDEAFGVGTDQPGVNVTLEVINSLPEYEPGRDDPEYLDDRGPRCYAGPVPPGQNAPQYPPGGPLQDGAEPTPRSDSEADRVAEDLPEDTGTVPQTAVTDPLLPNSVAERRLVAELLALTTGRDPSEIPSWTTLLVGPLLRGTEVTVR